MNDQTNTAKAHTAKGAQGPVPAPGPRPEAHHPAALAVRSEEPSSYSTSADTAGRAEREAEAAILEQAEQILARRFERQGTLSSPSDSADWLRMRLAPRDAEVFCALFLDTRHRVLAFEELFQGTLDGAAVHPREVVRACLKHNAAAVILAHNHPSGEPEPSAADRHITSELKQALALIGVRVLDHLIVGATVVSLASRGLC